ncbi:MAG: DUF2817 domain-containing protein [Planctomycetaceae bacterium]
MGSPADLLPDFTEDYVTARSRFIRATSRADWQVVSHPLSAVGPAGEPLFIDVATAAGVGPAAINTVIVSSGLHGVEGIFGSAVQCASVERLAQRDPTAARPRLVFVHVLNPYGFAWLRRCNEENVDLNRNFLAERQSYQGSPDGYAKLNPMLNHPTRPSPYEFFLFRSLVAILRYGLPTLKRAIAAGQYDFPQGLFFGGRGPAESTRIVQHQFAGWLGYGGSVIHLDLHTGLGRSGDYQLLADLPPTPAQAARICRLFDKDVVAGHQSPSIAYTARGSISEWCLKYAANRDYNHLCVEFGTYRPTKVLAALRAENRAHHWDQRDSQTYRWAKDRLVEMFCPRSPSWRRRAAGQGVDLIERAINGLT